MLVVLSRVHTPLFMVVCFSEWFEDSKTHFLTWNMMEAEFASYLVHAIFAN